MDESKKIDQVVNLMLENKNDIAEIELKHIIEKYENNHDAFHLLGVIHLKRGEIKEAIRLISKAIALFPQFPVALANLAACYIEKKEYQPAIQFSEQALEMDTHCKGAWSNLICAKYHLGVTDKTKTDEMIEDLISELQLFPDDENLINNIGLLFSFKKDLDSAVKYFKKSWKNNSLSGCFQLACSLKDLSRYSEALETVEKALHLYPEHEAVLMSLKGLILYESGKIQEATSVFARTHEILPDNVDAQYSLSLLHLLQGNFSLGLELHECRSKTDWYKECKTPLWRGEDIEGKTLLICSEQGLGDLIQFFRYIPLLTSYRCKILISLPQRLHCLFAPLRLPLAIAEGPVPAHDVHVYMVSFPYIFKTNLSNIPPPISIPHVYRPIKNRIGIAWRGNAQHKKDRQRSLDVKLLSFLLKTPGMEFVCLQKDITPEEKRFLDAHKVKRFCLDTFTDTLHVLERCSRVISADTCIAHLSGSLNIPTWILLPYAPDWRWLLERKDSPWYPSATLFRQSVVDSWNEPLAEIKNQLIAELS